MTEAAIFQHPLAYLIGLEGIALMQAFGGAHDEAFTRARLAEVRRLLDGDGVPPLGDGVTLQPLGYGEAYAEWADFYDLGANGLIAAEEPAVRALIDPLAPGRALDAACGTGRHAAYLAARGHEVIGIDGSDEMLAHARRKVPGARFEAGELGALPLPDAHVDLVVCGLALMHVPALAPVLAELRRVLRPGGLMIVSDWRASAGGAVFPLVKRAPDGTPGYVPTWARPTSAYIGEALALGLEVRACEEITAPGHAVVDPDSAHPDPADPPEFDPAEPPDRAELARLCPEAANAVSAARPHVLVCAFRRPTG